MNNKLKISCRLENLKTIRQFVNDALVAFGVDKKSKDQLVLSVDEICANSMIHSCNQDSSMLLEIEIHNFVEQEMVSIEVTDQGSSFNLSLHQPQPIEDIIKNKKKGGMGLMLVMKMMDKIEYKSTSQPHQNVCTLYKKVNYA